MKLRNKKTGEIKGIQEIISEAFLSYELDSLKSIDTNWEEIEPKEPLIKDPKIRKAVRAWAEAVGGSPVCFYDDTDYEGVGRLKIYRQGYPAVFDLGHQFYDLEPNTQYTITELCGEIDCDPVKEMDGWREE